MRKVFAGGDVGPVNEFDLTFLENHPKVAGFMGAPIDGPYEAHCHSIVPATRQGLLDFIEKYSRVAPYYAWTYKTVDGFEHMVLRGGFVK